MLKCHKLGQEAVHLHHLLAQEEAHSRSLQEEITNLWKELHQNKRLLCGERYFQKRISRERNIRVTKDLRGVTEATDASFTTSNSGWTNVMNSCQLQLNRRSSHKRSYHRRPPDTGWGHGHISSNQMWNFSRQRR